MLKEKRFIEYMFETGYLKKRSRFLVGSGFNKYFLHRGKLYGFKGFELNSRYLNKYVVTLRFAENGVLRKSELESVKKLLVRKLKKNYVIHCTSFYPVGCKPSGVRMGKGKSFKLSDYCYGVRCGQSFISVYRLGKKSLGYIIKCLRLVSSKLHIKVSIVCLDGCGLVK